MLLTNAEEIRSFSTTNADCTNDASSHTSTRLATFGRWVAVSPVDYSQLHELPLLKLVLAVRLLIAKDKSSIIISIPKREKKESGQVINMC